MIANFEQKVEMDPCFHIPTIPSDMAFIPFASRYLDTHDCAFSNADLSAPIIFSTDV